MLHHLRSYSVLREIGRGANGVVFLAEKDGQKYAIKTLLGEADELVLDDLVRFKREADTMVRISHPGFVKVFDVFEEKNKPYIVMEYLDGNNLENLLKSGPFDQSQFISLAKNLAGALAEIHRLQLVHRDIKSANIILSNGVPKLVDLGLVGEMDPKMSSDNGLTVGTFAYSSPEQIGILKRPVDGRSDLYSLGATLFEAASGRTPFIFSDYNELFQKHTSENPPMLHEIVSGFNPILSRIVAKLLKADPDERYQSAKGFLSDIERLAELEEKSSKGEIVQLGEHDRGLAIGEVPLVGRETEVEQLKKSLIKASEAAGSIVLIEGEGGSGKSRLAKEITKEADRLGFLFLRGKCNSLDSIGLSVIREVLGGYFNQLNFLAEGERNNLLGKLKEAMGDNIVALSSLLPGIIGLTQRASTEKRDLDVFNAQLVQCFIGLSKNFPGLVICIDDVQWVDEASFEFLKKLSKEIKKENILLLVTARNESANKEQLESFKHSVKDAIGLSISLRTLGLADIKEMVTHILGGKEVDPQIFTRVASASEMNPFAIIEFVRTLLDSRSVHFTDGKWQLDEERLNSIKISHDLVELLIIRLNGLSEDTRRVLRSAAIGGAKLQANLMASVLSKPVDQIINTFQEAQSRSLIEPFGTGTYVFVHDRVREALIAGIVEKESRQIHRKYIDVLVTNGLDQGEEGIFNLAFHSQHADLSGIEHEALHYCLKAGQLALATYSNKQALKILEFSIRLSDKLKLTNELNIEIGESYGIACLNLGLAQEADVAFSKCLELTRGTRDESRIIYWKMRTRAAQGQLIETCKLFEESLQKIGKSFPKGKGQKVLSLLWYLSIAILRTRLPFGYAKYARDRVKYSEGIKEAELLSKIYETGLLAQFSESRMLDYVLSIFKLNYYVFKLGPSRDLTQALVLMVTVFASLKIKNLYSKTFSLIDQIKSELKDRGVDAYVEYYRVVCKLFLGDLDRVEPEIQRSLVDVTKYLSMYYQAQNLFSMYAVFNHRGKSSEMYRAFLNTYAQLDQTREYGIMAIARYLMVGNLYAMGLDPEAFQVENEADEIAKKVPNHGVRGLKLLTTIICKLEKADFFDRSLDTEIETFLKEYGQGNFFWNIGYASLMYIRLQQAEYTKNESEKKKYIGKLKEMIKFFRKVALTPLHQCHLYIALAAIERFAQRPGKAFQLLQRAEMLALESESQVGRFWVHLESGRCYKMLGNVARVEFEIKAALEIAKGLGWTRKVEFYKSEFGVVFKTIEQPIPTAQALPTEKRTVTIDLKARRYIDVLIQVSTAAARTFVPLDQARVMLDAMLRLMGAEKAYIFLTDGKVEKFYAGRDVGGNDLQIAQDFSMSVVKKVFDTNKAVIYTGTVDGQQLGSESIVAYNLKSIMVAPMMFNEKIMGVLYLDSSFAKNLFNESDLDIFHAVATQLAVGIRMAENANLEAERRELKKDAEVLGVVQKMFLPRIQNISDEKFSVSGLYRPAAQCGGDWWWHQRRTNGNLVCMIADVTGHGAGPAMITASFATSYFTLINSLINSSLEEVLEKMNGELFRIAKEEYFVSVFAFEFNPETKFLQYWCAGHPFPILLGHEGQIAGVGDRSSLMGASKSFMVSGERQLMTGDRLFLYTDGIPELELADGRQFGERRLVSFLKKNRSQKPKELLINLIEQIDLEKGQMPQPDDITCICFDVL